MTEKRFILCQDDLGNYEIRYNDKVFHFLWEVAPILNEQQDTIKELERNFDDLVEWASKIAKRNVLLDEKIGKIQQGIRGAYEKKPYPTLEDIRKELENE